MHYFRTFLSIQLLSLILFSCTPKPAPVPIQMEFSGPYNNMELITALFQADTLIPEETRALSVEVKSHFLLWRLRLNIQMNKSGAYYPVNSNILGFSAAKDTADVAKVLRNSPVMPADALYEWIPVYDPDPEYGLVAHRSEETSVMLTEKDLASIRIEPGNSSQSTGLKGLVQETAATNKMIRIMLNPPGISKLRDLKKPDALFLRMNFGGRKVAFSLETAELTKGFLLTQNISKTFVDSVSQMYPSILKQQ